MSAMTKEMGELVRRISLDTIGTAPRMVRIEASDAEQRALARRFGWLGLANLKASAELRVCAGGIAVRGTVSGRVTQACVATGDPVPEDVSADFDLLFVPEAESGQSPSDKTGEETGEEIELSGAELDQIEFDGQAIDLGDAVAQTLALAVSPFPRSPQAAAALEAAGVQTETMGGAAAGPLARALRHALGKGH